MWLFQLDLFLVLQSGIFGEAGVDRLFYFASVWQTLLSTFAGHLSWDFSGFRHVILYQ